MSKKINFIYGTYKTEIELETALTALENSGFKRREISVLCPEMDRSAQYIVKNTKAPEVALIGAIIGGLIGGLWGWTSGLSMAGISIVSNSGVMTAPHPVLAGLASLACGAIAGGLCGALIGYKIPEYELKNNNLCMQEGRRLLSVIAKNETITAKARQVLEATGAINVACTEEPWSTYNYSKNSQDPNSTSTTTVVSRQNDPELTL